MMARSQDLGCGCNANLQAWPFFPSHVGGKASSTVWHDAVLQCTGPELLYMKASRSGARLSHLRYEVLPFVLANTASTFLPYMVCSNHNGTFPDWKA